MYTFEDIDYVEIDARCKFNYASYYILGLEQGEVRYKFSLNSSFADVMSNHEDYTRGCAMIFYLKNGQKRNVFLDYHDDNDILDKAYEWSDVYASVNICKSKIKEKVLPIGPSCGVRVYSFPKLTRTMFSNMCKIFSRGGYKPPIKDILRDYYYTLYRRIPYEKYFDRVPVVQDYCFAISTLWYDEVTDKYTNNYRHMFIKVCSNIIPKFEGGFFLIKGAEKFFEKYSSYMETYQGLIFHTRISLKEYIKKTKKSIIVFNTPSVKLCLGWKLAEYLMMGKAIISTEIENVMPGNFLKGKQYLLARNEDEIDMAVRKLFENRVLREKMEHSAKQYFNEYLSPTKVLERILNFNN